MHCTTGGMKSPEGDLALACQPAVLENQLIDVAEIAGERMHENHLQLEKNVYILVYVRVGALSHEGCRRKNIKNLKKGIDK